MVVEQDEVGLKLLGPAQRLAGVGGVADDLQLRVAREQRGEPAPEERVVVDDQDADGALVHGGQGGQCRVPATRPISAWVEAVEIDGMRGGSVRTIDVPRPGVEMTSSAPPTFSARSAMIRKPT
jgi:hypothetical protein